MRKLIYLLLLCLFSTFACVPANAEEKKVWHIAYFEAGPYISYQTILLGFMTRLQEKGLIGPGSPTLPKNSESSKEIWDFLAQNCTSDSVVFEQDAFYSADWDEEKRLAEKTILLDRVKNGEINLVIAYGTLCGIEMANAKLDIPVLVAGVSNAVEAGISKSVEDSGQDNLFSVIEPNRHVHQLELFHDLFPFKKLGIAYEDTDGGKKTIALNEIELAAKNMNVELVRCIDTFDIPDVNLSSERLLACHQKLADQGVDAVYVTLNLGMQAGHMTEVLKPLTDKQIPTFSQLGVSEVIGGVLLSIAQFDLAEQGKFNAEALLSVLAGKKPRDLSQIFEGVVSLAMNIRTATLIGWNPPLEVLAAVDEIYM